MEKKRVTKKDMFKRIMEVTTDAEILEFCKKEIDLLNKKNANTKMTETQKENEEIKKTIVSELERVAKPVTITELQELSESLAPYGNQKLTYLFTKLNKDGIIKREYIKRKAYFSALDSEE